MHLLQDQLFLNLKIFNKIQKMNLKYLGEFATTTTPQDLNRCWHLYMTKKNNLSMCSLWNQIFENICRFLCLAGFSLIWEAIWLHETMTDSEPQKQRHSPSDQTILQPTHYTQQQNFVLVWLILNSNTSTKKIFLNSISTLCLNT